jgi:hypothetical protein
VKLLVSTLDHIVLKQPDERKHSPKQHLCTDRGYAGEPAQEAMESHGEQELHPPCPSKR